jgi:hypothetical protein
MLIFGVLDIAQVLGKYCYILLGTPGGGAMRKREESTKELPCSWLYATLFIMLT